MKRLITAVVVIAAIIATVSAAVVSSSNDYPDVFVPVSDIHHVTSAGTTKNAFILNYKGDTLVVTAHLTEYQAVKSYDIDLEMSITKGYILDGETYYEAIDALDNWTVMPGRYGNKTASNDN